MSCLLIADSFRCPLGLTRPSDWPVSSTCDYVYITSNYVRISVIPQRPCLRKRYCSLIPGNSNQICRQVTSRKMKISVMQGDLTPSSATVVQWRHIQVLIHQSNCAATLQAILVVYLCSRQVTTSKMKISMIRRGNLLPLSATVLQWLHIGIHSSSPL